MDESMNSEQCANFLHIHENTLIEKISTGEIPAAKIGRGWVFLKSDIVDYLRKQIRTSTAERKVRNDVGKTVEAAENRGVETITPRLITRTVSRRRTPPALPDMPSPEFVCQLACS